MAYNGPPIHLDLLLLRAEHSLLVQSLHATHSDQTTNGDGFGIAWYGDRPEPGMFKDVRPAWNDENLRDLAVHVRSPLFLAHVRAATGTPIQRTNCHPFRYRSWVFQHNGVVPEFARLRRAMTLDVAPELFKSIQGSTDSELLFHMALTYGLEDDPQGALQRTVSRIEALRAEHGIAAPFHFVVALADGEEIHAVRYSSDRASRSLFTTRDARPLREIDPTVEIPADSILIASEPLGTRVRWEGVPESTYIVAGNDRVERRPFVVDA
jgi:glutamine amidotransferase